MLKVKLVLPDVSCSAAVLVPVAAVVVAVVGSVVVVQLAVVYVVVVGVVVVGAVDTDVVVFTLCDLAKMVCGDAVLQHLFCYFPYLLRFSWMQQHF